MGSFPTRTAANLLKLIFKPTVAAATNATVYTNSTSATQGIYTASSTVPTPLYIGLIKGTFSTGVPDNTAIALALTDAAIRSTGNNPWPVVTGGTYSLAEYWWSDSASTRPAITFNAVEGDVENATALPFVRGPESSISFASTGGAQGQGIIAAPNYIVGFFITTLSTGTGVPNPANVPTIVAYGRLSGGRVVGSGDNPTFAANAITITLD